MEVKIRKETLAYAEQKVTKSKSPLVDELCDTNVKYSPKYSHELTLLAKKLEAELAEEKKKSNRLLEKIQFMNALEKKNPNERREKREYGDRSTAFDSLSNHDVMERLRTFGFGRIN